MHSNTTMTRRGTVDAIDDDLRKANGTLHEASLVLAARYDALIEVSKLTKATSSDEKFHDDKHIQPQPLNPFDEDNSFDSHSLDSILIVDDFSVEVLHKRVQKDLKHQYDYQKTLDELKSKTELYKRKQIENTELFHKFVESETLRIKKEETNLAVAHLKLKRDIRVAWDAKVETDTAKFEKKYNEDLRHHKSNEAAFEEAKKAYKKLYNDMTTYQWTDDFAKKEYFKFIGSIHGQVAIPQTDETLLAKDIYKLGKNCLPVFEEPKRQHAEPKTNDIHINSLNLDELVKKAEQIGDQDLIAEAKKHRATQQTYDKSGKIKRKKAYEDYFHLTYNSTIEYDALLLASDALTAGYKAASQSLTSESRAAYKAIKDAQHALTKELKDELASIAKHYATLNDCLSASYDQDAMWGKFSREMADYPAKLQISIAKKLDLKQKLQAIVGMYQKAHEEFGVVTRSNDLLDHQKICEKKFSDIDDMVKNANTALTKCKNKLKGYKLHKMQKDMIALLQKAIVNNVDFWNKQITFRSSAQIGETQVPTGIADMNDKLSLEKNPKEMLAEFRSVVESRIAPRVSFWGPTMRLNFFGVRTQATTGKFYEIVKAIDFMNFKEDSCANLQKALSEIQYTDAKKGIVKLDLNKPLSAKKPSPRYLDNAVPVRSAASTLRAK